MQGLKVGEALSWRGANSFVLCGLFLLASIDICFPQRIRPTHFELNKPRTNSDLINDQQNLDATIVLRRVPHGLFLEGDESDTSLVKWEPAMPVSFRYGTKPGSRDLSNYPNTLDSTGTEQLVLNPAMEGMGTGIYYCILVSDEDPTLTSVEFRIIVQAHAVPIAKSPLGTINVDQGPPLFSWDAVEGVPYYFLFLSEGPLSIDSNAQGEITGLTGLNLTWRVITPTTFVTFGDADPSGHFANTHVPPLLPGIEYNWIVLNSYGPGTDLISTEVAPVAPSFFQVNRTLLLHTPNLVQPDTEALIADDEILFEWSPVPDVSRYRLFLYEAAEFGGSDIEVSIWSQITSDTQLRLKANKLLVKTQYFWRVVAENANGISASERRPFQYDGSAGWIKFTVDSREGPLSRVAIEIKNEIDGSTLFPALTDTFGVDKLPLPTGTYSYRASRPGFLPTPRNTFTVPNGDTNSVNIQLSRGSSTISGQIVDPFRNPIFDATVELVSGEVIETVRSDAGGYFTFAALPSNWLLRAYKSEFVRSDFQAITLQEEQAVDIGQIAIEAATNTVSGQVTFAADGLPLAGTLVRAQQGDIVFETTTGSAGGFRFILGPGTWGVTLEPQGFFASPPDYTFDLTQNQQRSAAFQLSPGGLVYGQISFQNIGVANAAVQAFTLATGELKQKAISNIHGNYSLGLPAGDFELRVSSQNFLELRRNVSISEGQTSVENFVLTEAGFLQGTVINLGTASPVEGATVFVVEDSSIQTTSDKNGEYLLGLPPNTPFQIDAFLPGFGSNGPFTVTTLSGETIRQDFLLRPLSGIIRGQVTDGFLPIEGASIEFREAHLTVLSDTDGRFEVQISPGLYTVSTSKECHVTKTETVDLAAGVTLDLNITLRALKSVITGTVSDVSGNPIVGAEVLAIGDTVFAATTELTGNYELCLNAGIFRVSARQSGYLSTDTTVVISDGDSLGNINFVLKDNFAHLTGTVHDTSNNPIVQATVKLTNHAQTLLDTTDSAGTFAIGKIIPEIRSEIAASKPGFFGKKTPFFFLGQQEVNLNLVLYPADGSISGTVRDSQDNSGIPEALLSATLSGDSEVFFSALTDESGQYTISELPIIPNRSYQVFAFKEGFFSPGPITEVLPNSEGVDFFLVNKSGIISGLVRDIDTREPLENARVEATNGSGGRSLAFSDSSGAFSLTELVPTEAYDLSAVKSGFFAQQVRGVAPGDSTVMVELLRRYGFVIGKILDYSTSQAIANVPVVAMPNGPNGREVSASTDTNGQYLLRLIADNYTIRPMLTHNRSEPTFVQLDVGEIDTVNSVDFTLELQTVQSIGIQRADLVQKPAISNQEMHCYVANAWDVLNRPVNIGSPRWALSVSEEAATIDAEGCVHLNPNYFGDLTIIATDALTGVQGHLGVQVFAPIDSTTHTVLFDDRGLLLRLSKNSVVSKKELRVSKEPLAPAKQGRAEIFTTTFSHVLKPAGLVFNKALTLMLEAPPNSLGQRIFIAKWDSDRSEWINLATSPAENSSYQASIFETGEYVALALARPLTIDNFRLLPNPFSPFQENDGQMGLEIAFDISSSAAPNPLLTVKIYNLEGNLVRLLHDQTPFTRGHATVHWDGKTDNGALARNGRYLVRVILEDPQGSKEQMKSVVLIK